MCVKLSLSERKFFLLKFWIFPTEQKLTRKHFTHTHSIHTLLKEFFVSVLSTLNFPRSLIACLTTCGLPVTARLLNILHAAVHFYLQLNSM